MIKKLVVTPLGVGLLWGVLGAPNLGSYLPPGSRPDLDNRVTILCRIVW